LNIFLKGNFTGPDDLNLILAKNSKIEIHLVSPEGLRHVLDVNIYGIVTCMQIFRPKVSGNISTMLKGNLIAVLTLEPSLVSSLQAWENKSKHNEMIGY